MGCAEGGGRVTVTYHPELIQGSEEWMAARCGLLTASEMRLILTPAKLKMADNGEMRGHLHELLSQRITRHVETAYISYDMLRGQEEEVLARYTYNEKYAEVTEVGFVTNDRFGFTIGYSPDGLVGDDGLIECKSRRQKFQIETIVTGAVPDEFMLQCQTGLLVTERKWLDFVSYSGGLPMVTIRVYPVPEIQDAIVEAAEAFEARIVMKMEAYGAALASEARLIPTERTIQQDITV